jgi:hypothetical protein
MLCVCQFSCVSAASGTLKHREKPSKLPCITRAHMLSAVRARWQSRSFFQVRWKCACLAEVGIGFRSQNPLRLSEAHLPEVPQQCRVLGAVCLHSHSDRAPGHFRGPATIGVTMDGVDEIVL